MSTAICCKQTWNERCRNWEVWDGICKKLKFRSTKVQILQLWQLSPIWQFFLCLLLFDQLFANMTMHNRFDCMYLVPSFSSFFFSFSQAFSCGPLLTFSHMTHIRSFSSDPLMTFLQSLGCNFFSPLFAFKLPTNDVVQKNLSSLVILFKTQIKGRAIMQLTACFVSGWVDEMNIPANNLLPSHLFASNYNLFVFV
jgi:hypothetical protein